VDLTQVRALLAGLSHPDRHGRSDEQVALAAPAPASPLRRPSRRPNTRPRFGRWPGAVGAWSDGSIHAAASAFVRLIWGNYSARWVGAVEGQGWAADLTAAEAADGAV
jgi:hypothetical protein